MNRFFIIAVFLLFVLLFSLITSSATEKDNVVDDTDGVRPGIEVFLSDHLDWVKGKKVGLITNPTGVASNVVTDDIDLLFQHPNVHLTALFGPEHGIRGNQEAGEYVESYTDERTGLPVYSLYGPTWKPTEEMLEDVDVLLFDIQDIGSNVYTYIYTLGFVMEAAAEYDKEVIVLDRPNPIGGTKVEGPLRSEETVSFMGRFLLPVRHGLTIGELATMWNHEYSMGVNVKVAKMEGWERTMHFEDTGLPWVMTSPNIPTEESAYLYAGTELLENTSLSTGLGTTQPFELVGAPGIDGEALAQEMNSRNIEGVTFGSTYYRPTSGKYEGELVGGVQIHMEDPTTIDLVELGLQLVDGMRDQNPEDFTMDESYAELIGDTDVPEMIMNDTPVDEIIESWEGELNTWVDEIRNPYLRYGPYPNDVDPYEEQASIGILPLDLNAAPGESVDLTIKGYDENGEKIEIDASAVQWEVSNNIGYVEDGVFYAENEGKGELTAEYNGLTASREVDISSPYVEDIRSGIHADYSRIVFDLNKTVTNYEMEETDEQLILRIPFGEIEGDLHEEGGSIPIDNSPVISSIDYYLENNMFVAELNLKVDELEYEIPDYSSQIVVDLMH
ncbi:DUF1343 domain-containing protein [Virgibacillus sp. NKC19-3]|nr:DUF1343 domain-containing protein [Virgibacillus sp. NKC19-3]